MRSHFVHMYVPARLLPVYVLLVGRRQCCGTRRAATHLDGCRRHPWSARSQGCPGATRSVQPAAR